VASVTKFAKTVSQTTGGSYVTWSNLNNIRNTSSGAYAISSVLIKKKGTSPNRPSSITCTNFDFNLPQGAEPTKVRVLYNHKKTGGSDVSSKYPNHICNIGSPTISLVGVSGFSSKGTAPTTSFADHTKTFNVTGKLSRSQVNSSGFGCKINYPSNSNGYDGYMSVSYVKVTVEYKLSEYSLGIGKVSGGYNGDDYTIQLSISNKNLTSFNPSLTLSSPLGFSFKEAKGNGSLTQNSARGFTWNPKLSSKVGTSTINVTFSTDVTFPSGSDSYTGTFELSESLYGTSKGLNAVITKKPPSEEEETGISEEVIEADDGTDTVDVLKVTEMVPFNITSDLSGVDWENEDLHIRMFTDTIDWEYWENKDYDPHVQNLSARLEYNRGDSWQYPIEHIVVIPDDISADYRLDWQFRVTDFYKKWEDSNNIEHVNDGCYAINLISYDFINDQYTDTFNAWIKINVNIGETKLSSPNYSILELTGEEMDRLGNGYPYVLQAYLKHTTTDTFVRDWYKNNRIGVFNNAIEENITITQIEVDGETTDVVEDTTDYDNLTSEEIFTNAEYWSNTVSEVNEYDNLECEFPFNKNYPVYLIITGDYPEATDYGYNIGTVKHTTPCIIEKQVYRQREDTGNYPIPISHLITENSSAEETIEAMNTSTSVILFDLPLDEDYGSNEDQVIRGFQIDGTLDQTNELVLTATLTNPDGIKGQRSIILNPLDNDEQTNFKLGGLGDLWGFKSTDIHHLEDWELTIDISNILNDDVSSINYGDIKITIYVETLDKQNINIKIDDEDLSFYGAFIEDAIIPEGLDTDTSFLSIDGSDVNDAYRQNIREKTIKLTLSINDCDLQTNTDLLRQLTKLLVNDKDEYNRPIPKRIEFSHYPDVYFEYIMEKSMDITNEAGSYIIKAELTVPSGTSYSKQTNSTNVYGFVQGLAAINPVITFKPQSDEVTITEIITGQSFHIGYSGDWQSGIVEINCEDRVVLLKTSEDDSYPLDISKYVNFNSDWFRLHGEYSFSSTGCVIRTVEYQERW